MHRVQRVRPPRARWSRLVWLGGVILLPAAGCDEAEEILETVGDNEVFEFYFAYATHNAQNAYYVVQRGSAGNCTNPMAGNLTLAQLADLIQAQNTSYGIQACATQFLIAGTDVEAVRNTGVLFGTTTTGGQNLTIYANGHSTTNAQNPSGISIFTSGGITVGQKTTLASAEIAFGTVGDVWACADGGPIWADNANSAGATFFEITVTELDDTDKRAAGDFQCIARNTTDTLDTRLLLILDGGFATRINN